MVGIAKCLVLALSFAAWSAAAAPADADRDGLTDEQERILGTDPNQPDVFKTILRDGPEPETRRRLPTYDPSKDVVTVSFCHAGGDRYLFRATLAGNARPNDTVLHFYVDADANPRTGRKGNPKSYSTGTEYMVSVVKGRAYVTCYAPDGSRRPTRPASYVAQKRAIIASADLNLGRDKQGARFALYVLCHTAVQRPPMSDSVPKRVLSGLPLVNRPKIRRPADLDHSEGVDATFGHNLLFRTLTRKDVIVVPYYKLGMERAEVDVFTSRRFGHVKMLGRGSKVWTTAPRAGTYHVGFMMYDDGNDERIVIRINGKVKGVAVANADNYRTWLYWLRKPYAFRGGERVELEAAGAGGKHGVCNILFLPKPPPARRVDYKVRHLEFFTPVGRDGQAIVSWITTWPCAARFEWGETPRYGRVSEVDERMLVHRVVLKGLDPGKRYHGRAVGFTRDGKPYYSPDVVFQARAKTPPPTVEGRHRVALRVTNTQPVAATRWPITTGVPFPAGVLGSADDVRLLRGGREVPAQVAVTARWPDGSVKWILVSFVADAPASGVSAYELEYGRGVRRSAAPERPARVERQADGLVIDTGALRVRIDRHGQLVLPSGQPCRTDLAHAGGKVFSSATAKAAVAVEEAGPVRVVVKTTARLETPNGEKSFLIEKRIIAYAGLPELRVNHTFVVARPEPYVDIEELRFTVPVRAGSWRLLLEAGGETALTPAAAWVRQRFDNEFVSPRGARKGRLVGAALARGAQGCAVAVRRFWQLYPKSFALADDGLRIGLCPDFEPGLYDRFPFEREGHHLYFYLLHGHYKFKQGMARTHELLLCFAPERERAARCALFQTPALASPPPEWNCASKAFYDIAPRDPTRFKMYEEGIDTNLKRYVAARERQHDYGLMNYGDWYGERGANWGNIEYDTQHAFILQYVRSGDPAAFFLADDTEKHNRDIDTIHWAPDPHLIGAVYVHQMGHVGGYYTRSVPGTLGIPRAGYTVSHAWAEGHFDHYFLTGDRRSLETGRAVADFFCRKMLCRPYDFTSCRVPGWHLIMNAIAYASTLDPYYLNASRVIAERVMEAQDLVPRPLPPYQREPGRTLQVGGWSRMMVPGHCRCIPRHRGNAGFMVAVLLSGMKYYYAVTHDPRVKECIIRGARYLLDECYSDKVGGFRYTSCPKTRYRPGAMPLMVEGVARAYLWTRDERFKRVLTQGLAISTRGSAYGKGFSMYYRVGPRVLADLAATGLTLNERPLPPRVPFKKPAWLARLKPDQLIVIQAEDFAREGGGRCQIRADRQATWGKMITHWHADVGHWLEWKFKVPKAGDYTICFRYATGSPATRRSLEIDGRTPCAEARSIAFPVTGGYGHRPTDWKYLTLKDAQGRRIPLRLSAGEHRLHMTNLHDGLGLDFIALVRVP